MKFAFAFFALILGFTGSTQNNFPFSISIESVKLEGFSGLQSYAWAKSGSKILLVGGRTDGLHRRQPFASFNKKNNNTDLIVWDIRTGKIWKKSVTVFSVPLAEQLQSTNMEFFQYQNDLILIGGYGYSATKRNHITHPSIVKIRIKEVINGIIKNNDITPYIMQLADERMAVTGGRLSMLGNTFYLVGGQRFDGRYNPHGPDHGPGFSQMYTNQIRKFNIEKKAGRLVITNYSAITDSLLLHRRDYNLVSQLDALGKEMLTIYSGVFQYDKDIPFTTLVDINSDGHREVAGFNQQFSHYHTATLPIYSRSKEKMYSAFFGGIAQHYPDSSGNVITDNNIPFVKTISIIERSQNKILEYALPETMPGYFGAGAEFIIADEKLFLRNGILNLDKISKKAVLAGYIIGGIESKNSNVFWNNTDDDPSRASPVIWKVYINK